MHNCRVAGTLHSRGQTLPVWGLAILSSLVLMFFAINYGSLLRWQVRLQNDADAAAGGIIAQQTEVYNEMETLLYSSAVEEYRMRKYLDNIYASVHQFGGCTSTADCANMVYGQSQYFTIASSRYTQLVNLLHGVTATATTANFTSDATQYVTDLNANQCVGSDDPDHGDCHVNYGLIDISGRGGTHTVCHTAWQMNVEKPWAGSGTTESACSGSSAPSASWVLTPVQTEVCASTTVKPIIPSFFGLNGNPYKVVARAAATSAQVEHDWFQPGWILQDYGATGKFQPVENAGDNSWYNVDYGGAPTAAIVTSATPGPTPTAAPSATPGPTNSPGVWNAFYYAPSPNIDFEVEMGWWGAVPIAPYHGGSCP